MALLRNIGGIGMALAELTASDLDTSGTLVKPTTGIPVYIPRVPLPIDTLPVNDTRNIEAIPADKPIDANQVTTASRVTDNWQLLLSLGSLYYTLVTGEGLVIKNKYLTAGGSIALLLYSLNKK